MLAAALAGALAAPRGGPLDALIHAHAATTLLVDGAAPDETAIVLAATLAAVERIGLARGRVTALVTSDDGDGSRARRTAHAVERLGLVCAVHDVERSPCFPAGRLADGQAIELDDALREAESVIALAPAARLIDGASAWLFRATASRAALETCDAVAAGRFLAEHHPIDLLVCWRRGPERDEAWAGAAAHVEWAVRAIERR